MVLPITVPESACGNTNQSRFTVECGPSRGRSCLFRVGGDLDTSGRSADTRSIYGETTEKAEIVGMEEKHTASWPAPLVLTVSKRISRVSVV